MTHKQRKWIQETKSKPLDLRGRAGQTFSSRNTSIKQDYDGRSRFVTFDTTIQGKDTYTLTDRGHKGWRQETVDKRSEGSRKGSSCNLWIERRTGYIYRTLTITRHSQLQTLYYTITHFMKEGIRRHYSDQTGRVPESSTVPRDIGHARP